MYLANVSLVNDRILGKCGTSLSSKLFVSIGNFGGKWLIIQFYHVVFDDLFITGEPRRSVTQKSGHLLNVSPKIEIENDRWLHHSSKHAIPVACYPWYTCLCNPTYNYRIRNIEEYTME